jgi:uncharacterized protein (TIGR02391 family)
MIDRFPLKEVMLNLEPEDLASYLLEYLISQTDAGQQFQRVNFCSQVATAYSVANFSPLTRLFQESFLWLEREGLVAPIPTDTNGWMYVTDRGKKNRGSTSLALIRKASLLPKSILNPKLLTQVLSTFLRGDYETAVFQSYKIIEVEVRTKGNFLQTDIGTQLMRLAFNPTNGPLSDQSLVFAEREAVAAIFAGAIGRFKNPGSHRKTDIQIEEAVELILFANHLLRILDNCPAAP